ncbi:excalibur calcium-binding domain-containing protein [Streptomyces sp. NPDC005931]|uniref:excalibur calcium-binding domain-containing protein n=1 Tax=Streptomyces sp. NPDC005931 TaxID=3364737 RepID=UPI003691EA57
MRLVVHSEAGADRLEAVMAGSVRGDGPIRRRWARMGLLARVVAVVLGLLVAFIVLGGVLEACGSAEDRPQSPATTSDAESTPPSSPDVREQPTADTELPAAPTVTETETVTEEETTGDETREPAPSTSAADVYYDNCDEARAAGDAPLHAGDPGYGPHLDRDGDGVACEPYAGQ